MLQPKVTSSEESAREQLSLLAAGETMNATWNGITKVSTLKRWAVDVRQQASYAAKQYQWAELLTLLGEHPDLVNAPRLRSRSLYAPLHQAAHGGAPKEVIEELIRLGAWRTLRTSRCELPRDIALRKGHTDLISILEPRYLRDCPTDTLRSIRNSLHRLILERAGQLVKEHSLRLPELEPFLEMEARADMWFQVPGMYGGFLIRLMANSTGSFLHVHSWNRVWDPDGEYHEVHPDGYREITGFEAFGQGTRTVSE